MGSTVAGGKVFITLVMMLLFLGTKPVHAGNDVGCPDTEVHTKVRSAEGRVRALVVLLHGMGSNETDMFVLAEHLPADLEVIALRAPVAMDTVRYCWYAIDRAKDVPVVDTVQAERSRQAILHFLGEQRKVHGADLPIYLCGFSQGAIMAYSVALSEPTMVSGVAALSGRVLPQSSRATAPAASVRELRFFISHGVSDPVLRVEEARAARGLLTAMGATPEYFEYPGVHSISKEALNRLVLWLGGN